MRRYIFIVILLTSFIFARSDALVVGASDYRSSEIKKLGGVKYDIENIKSVLHTLKISESHITTLKEKRATLRNLRNFFKSYIHSNKNRRENLFVFYFSGHGLQVKDVSGDEKNDHLDEASVLYDIKMTKGSISGGILLDDELYTWLSKIKSKKVLIFDKCHSDSSHRGLGVGYEKVIKGIFKLSPRFINQMKALPKVENALRDVIVISATKSKEIAEDTPIGGLFTQSLLQGIVYKKAKQGREITLGGLENFCNHSVYSIAKRIRKDFSGASEIKGAFHPRFRPNRKRNLTLKSIFNIHQYQSISSQKRRDKKNREEEIISSYLLESTLDKLSNERVIQSRPVNGRRTYKEGESISIRFNSKKSGYLNILVARKNSYTLFTPKALKIKANRKYTFPESFYFDNRALRAKRPFGTTKIYLILSRKPWDVGKNMMALKSNDLETTYNFTKELVPSQEVYYNQKRKREEYRKVKPNILGISRVKINVIPRTD